MPLVSSVVDVPCRMEVYALVWEAVVEEEMQPSVDGSGGGLYIYFIFVQLSEQKQLSHHTKQLSHHTKAYYYGFRE